MDCIWPLGAALGEGPLWDGASERLWSVDIKSGNIHSCDAGGGDRRTCAVGGNPSFIQLAGDGRFVVGNGHALFEFDGERIGKEIVRLAMPDDNRFNDATVDPAGRLWFGSMDDRESARNGAVHVLVDGVPHSAGGAAVITNGPAVSGDGRWLYHVDTLDRTIWRFDIGDAPRLERGEVFTRIAEADGTPDGVTVDAADHLWVGLWGGWAARRYAPDGRLVDEVRFPCANITKLAFGGPDLKTAFATTARIGLSDAALAGQPLAGGIFRFSVDVPGVPANMAKVAT